MPCVATTVAPNITWPGLPNACRRPAHVTQVCFESDGDPGGPVHECDTGFAAAPGVLPGRLQNRLKYLIQLTVHHTQVLHRCCHHALGNCMAAVDDRGAAWLQLGFGEGLLHALSCLPVDQAEMRVGG